MVLAALFPLWASPRAVQSPSQNLHADSLVLVANLAAACATQVRPSPPFPTPLATSPHLAIQWEIGEGKALCTS